MKKVLMTATPPTSNGDLHVGHLSGPYLAADVYRRFLRAHGLPAFYNFGGDDNQSYLFLKGHQLGMEPAAVAAKFNAAINSTLERADIRLDHYVSPLTSTHHKPFVERFVKQLWDDGHLVAKEAETLWCADTDIYLYEAHVGGTCKHCRASADGNICENCARPNVVTDIIDPRSKYSDKPPVKKTIKQLFFPLSRWAERLAEYHQRVNMDPHLAALCEAMLADGLPDIPISHPSPWGIPVPFDGFEGQCLYAWFEMAPGYLSSTQEMLDVLGRDEFWEDYWKSDDAERVQFFGFDNGYFHSIMFPAAWMAFDPEIRLPDTFVTNEFFTLDGKKFSTSRGHAVWGQEALDHLPSDVLRYYLCANRPETEQTDFRLPQVQATIERQLEGRWQRWLLDLGERVREQADGKAPAAGEPTRYQARFRADMDRLGPEVTRAFQAESFSPQRAVAMLDEIVRTARAFGQAERHSESSRDTALALELGAAALLAGLAAPILPNFAQRLRRELGYSDAPEGWSDQLATLPTGQSIAGLDQPFFPDVAEACAAIGAARAAREATR